MKREEPPGTKSSCSVKLVNALPHTMWWCKYFVDMGKRVGVDV